MAKGSTKRRKPTRKGAVRKADKAFGDYIKSRPNRRCFVCGSPDNLQCGHVFTRERLSTRWHPWNAEIQCAGCNLRHEHDPYRFFKKYREKYGQERIEQLYQIHNTTIKLTVNDILQIAEHYQNLVEEGERWLPFSEELPSQLYPTQSSTTKDFPSQT